MCDRRQFLSQSVFGIGGAFLIPGLSARGREGHPMLAGSERFPYFRSEPVSYLRVKMQDAVWAPRQRTIREVTVPWITSRQDAAGGLEAFRADPRRYAAQTRPGAMESIKFMEAMATVVGVQRDPAIEGLIDAWAQPLIEGQGADGYLQAGFPPGFGRPRERWQPVWWSHEDYVVGHYLEAAIAYRDATGRDALYRSAVRAADNMVATFLGSARAYAPGHQEIEQALMRLYGVTGDEKYLRLCGWLIGQRGHHEGRPSFGRYSQDHLPVKQQRTIEGHAVRAGYLFNGVTQYVGATSDAAYRDAALAVWDDLVDRKLYFHGAGGNKSARNEGYRKNPYCIPPDDAYAETCSVVANVYWAHNLFRLTGEARYLDVAERMLYNAFAASLSLEGDSSFYNNVAQTDAAAPRQADYATSCCPPNIVKLFSTVGGLFYSTDRDGVFVNHYGASEADVPVAGGVKLIQHTEYPWRGEVTVLVEPTKPAAFTVRLRFPEWAKAHTLSVNGEAVDVDPHHGWLAVRRTWTVGDRLELALRMETEQVTMPAQFQEYKDRVALRRGPIVYCLEEQDVAVPAGVPRSLGALYLPEEAPLTTEHRADLLGGVTVVRGELRQITVDDDEHPAQAMFVPYGVWANRTPGAMRIWVGARRSAFVDMVDPNRLGDTCVA